MKNKKRLKIALFHLAFFYSGGGEKLVLEEITGLKKLGHEVDCYAPVIEEKVCFPDLIGKYKIKTLLPGLPRFIYHLETLEIILASIFFPFVAWRFRKYDVVFGANQPGPWFGWLIKKFTGVPYVIYLAQPTRILYPRTIDKKTGLWVKEESRLLPLLIKLIKPFISWADNVSIKNADTVLVNGEYVASRIRQAYKVEPVVCAAGAYPEKGVVRNRWKGKVKVNGFKIRKPFILITNRHFPQKMFEYAINSMKKISRKIPGLSLVITGNKTEYTERLEDLVKKRSLEEKIVFTGYVKERAVNDLYKNSAVYVYTSPEEDFGMGVIESMAAGVPVVAWDKGGPATTVLNNKTGFLVRPYSQKRFEAKILQLLKDKELNKKMGEEAIKLVRARYTYKKHINILEKNLIKASRIK